MMKNNTTLNLMALAGVSALAGEVCSLIDPPRHDRFHHDGPTRLTKPKMRRAARDARRKAAKRSKKRNR